MARVCPQTCVADALKQAESLAAENVELRRMGEDALLDKCAMPSRHDNAMKVDNYVGGSDSSSVAHLRCLMRMIEVASSAQVCGGRPHIGPRLLLAGQFHFNQTLARSVCHS